jgi:hypothetical protein
MIRTFQCPGCELIEEHKIITRQDYEDCVCPLCQLDMNELDPREYTTYFFIRTQPGLIPCLDSQ